MMITDTYIRASSLTGYADCPRRTAARMFWHEIKEAGYTLRTTPKTIGAVVGTAMHAGAGYSLESKMDTGELGNATEADQRALEALDKETQEGELLYDAATADKNTAERQALNLVDTCRTHICPAIEPVAVEVRLEARISDGLILTGQADFREEGSIGDFKSGRMKRVNAPQYGAYMLLARSHGFEALKTKEYYVERVKLGKEQPLPVVTEYDGVAAENTAVAIIRKIDRDLQDFRERPNRHAFLANPSSMLCSNKYCPAWGTDFCKEHKK